MPSARPSSTTEPGRKRPGGPGWRRARRSLALPRPGGLGVLVEPHGRRGPAVHRGTCSWPSGTAAGPRSWRGSGSATERRARDRGVSPLARPRDTGRAHCLCAGGRSRGSPSGRRSVSQLDRDEARPDPAGEFEDGLAGGRDRTRSERGPVHHVRITRAFEMGVHEVTNGEFRAFAEVTAYEMEARSSTSRAAEASASISSARWSSGTCTPTGATGLPGLPAGSRRPGAAGQLARRRGVLPVALGQGEAHVPPADGGRVGVRGAGGNDGAVVDGRGSLGARQRRQHGGCEPPG